MFSINANSPFKVKIALLFTLFTYPLPSAAFDLKQLQGSWLMTIQIPLPTKTKKKDPPYISIISKKQFDETGNAISVIITAIENKISGNYEPLISYAIAEQTKWSVKGSKQLAEETVRCTVMQTDRIQTDQLPNAESVSKLRKMLHELALEACKPSTELFEIISVSDKSIVLRSDDADYEMKRAPTE